MFLQIETTYDQGQCVGVEVCLIVDCTSRSCGGAGDCKETACMDVPCDYEGPLFLEACGASVMMSIAPVTTSPWSTVPCGLVVVDVL